jgi:2-polyprenyl-3-methyl-5-hydroxy-6-metoxy-1,4-benzoquinol methylase
MQPHAADKLRAINREFYQTFAAAFAETRRRVQPGVSRILESVAPEESVLDLGCGSGGVAGRLHELGHQAPYVGLDASSTLLEEAQRDTVHKGAMFLLADLAQKGWSHVLASDFDHIFAFAVLHHIPGAAARLEVAQGMRELVRRKGVASVSTWNFLASQRLQERILPWEHVGLSVGEVDPGDYLLDWRRGGYGLRYVHYFTDGELAELAERADFQVVERFLSDGEGGVLGRYQRWRTDAG